MEIINATSAATLVNGITAVIQDNIAGVLFVLAVMVGIKLSRKFLNRSTNGKF